MAPTVEDVIRTLEIVRPAVKVVPVLGSVLEGAVETVLQTVETAQV